MKHARDDYNVRIQDTLPAEEGGIPADEPVFLLRAQDALAPMAIEAWVRGLEHHRGDPETAAAVRQHIDRMFEWQNTHGAKIPDAPAAELQSVIEREQTADAIGRARRGIEQGTEAQLRAEHDRQQASIDRARDDVHGHAQDQPDGFAG